MQKRHEAFAREYLIDFDVVRAYKLTCAVDGEAMDDVVAQKAGSRLLRSITVQRAIDQYECEIIAEHKLEKERVIQQLQRLYSSAMRDRDYSAANSALDKLMKHLGLYGEHQRQKRYSADELVGLRRKLEENGVTFSELNKPNVLDVNNPYMIDDAVVDKETTE